MFRRDPTKRPNVLTVPANRHLFKVIAVVFAAEALCSWVFGWALASLIVSAAWVGYGAGHGRGFKHGMDNSYAIQLRLQLEQIVMLEDAMAEELTPDAPPRVELAKVRGKVIEELRRVA